MLQSKPLRGDLEIHSFCNKEIFVCDIWKMKCSRRVHLSVHCIITPAIKDILLQLNYPFFSFFFFFFPIIAVPVKDTTEDPKVRA